MDDGLNQQTDRVGDNMPLSALHHLLRSIAARTTSLGGLHRLAVNDTSGWACLAPFSFPRGHQQRMVDGLPSPLGAPRIEVTLHRGEWRQVAWRIHYLAQTGLARSRRR